MGILVVRLLQIVQNAFSWVLACWNTEFSALDSSLNFECNFDEVSHGGNVCFLGLVDFRALFFSGVWSVSCFGSFRHVSRCVHAIACLSVKGLCLQGQCCDHGWRHVNAAVMLGWQLKI